MKPARRIEAPSIVRAWKKFVVCGCSHGWLVSRSAADNLFAFCDDYKPDVRVHLGDFTDMTALRAGAPGTKDEGVDIDNDVSNGLTFLERYGANVVLNGNHENRAWKLQQSPNAAVSKAAKDAVTHTTNFIRNKLRAKYLDSYVITESWLWMGPYKLGHGWMFAEAAIRDHADFAGNCIIAHVHRYGVERGRRLSGATGICVGMIADEKMLTYADGNKAKAKWTQSFIYGEYCDAELIHHARIINTSRTVEFDRV